MNPTTARVRTSINRSVAAASLGAALLLTSCAGGGGDSNTAASGASAASGFQGSDSGAASRDQSAGGAVKEGAPADAKGGVDLTPVVASQMLARTAALSIDVKDLQAAAGRVRDIATAAGGLVVTEKLASYDYAPDDGTSSGLTGTITLQVPGSKLDAVLADLSKVGTVRSRSLSSEDVKGQVVDTESRLDTMRESVARVRALMGQATKLSDIVALESELSRRQADLESLEAQLASLKDRVAMSPVSVSLQRIGATTPEDGPDNAFLVGLRNGWEAFAGAVAVILTLLGALLPFAIIAGLVGWPLVTWWRRRHPRNPMPPTATQPAAAPAPAPEPEPAATP
jgi:hypothetical protein